MINHSNTIFYLIDYMKITANCYFQFKFQTNFMNINDFDHITNDNCYIIMINELSKSKCKCTNTL